MVFYVFCLTWSNRAQYITTKFRGRALNEKIYLSEAEPFLEAYAKRSALNQKLVGFAGAVINTENFLSMFEYEDESVSEGDSLISTEPTNMDNTDKGMIVFFPGTVSSLTYFVDVVL